MDMETKNMHMIIEWIRELGKEAGEDEAFLQAFTDRLFASAESGDGIWEEFLYYMEKRDFLCQTKVADCTVVDIMVWQIDHFKAWLDRGNDEMKNNESKMVLRAFDTMLRMKEDAAKYKGRMESETGTDYPGKYK